MSDPTVADVVRTFTNPVYPHSFPDPFVLKHRGEYFAYSTGGTPDGRVFAILASPDLVNWREAGAAMDELADKPPFYWAPEVTYDNGKFYLYYSCGNETLMHIRVAVSARPDGGFVDSGRTLTNQDFAIDAHVFTDTDGARYLFYATDFLEHTNIGTGTVVDRMLNWFELEGDPKPVTRARYDWQVYDPKRKEKGDVRWHTVEGPAVLKRKGKYFEMFSGGNWQNTSYGVSFAVSDSVVGDQEWEQYSDGDTTLPILQSGLNIVGPGHNCVVRGPNNREFYCVYHRWTDAGRVMAIDRIDFAGDRIFLTGPTDSPQLVPYVPTVANILSAEHGSLRGEWKTIASSVCSSRSGTSERRYPVSGPFLCEFTFNCLEWNRKQAGFGFRLNGADGEKLEVAMMPAERSVALTNSASPADSSTRYLPLDFILDAGHLVRIESAENNVTFSIDGVAVNFTAATTFDITSLSLFSSSASIEYSGLSITEGFEELFDNNGHERFFRPNAAANIVRSEGEAQFGGDGEIAIGAGGYFDEAEFVANLRVADGGDSSVIGLQLIGRDRALYAGLFLGNGRVWMRSADVEVEQPHVPESDGKYRQFRLVKLRRHVVAFLDGIAIGEMPAEFGAAGVALFCSGGRAAVEMIRVTRIHS